MGLRPITYWIITDIRQPEGRKLLSAALDQMVGIVSFCIHSYCDFHINFYLQALSEH